MKTLAVIGKIVENSPIEKADRLEAVTVECDTSGKWHGVIQKGQFDIGDLALVFLQDALLPEREEWSFMKKYNWRVKMQRLRGAPSECLIMPVLPEISSPYIGMDVTSLLGVEKYEKPISSSVGSDALGTFPSFIPKTDELNYQAVPHLVDVLKAQKEVVATVKYDGSSCTFYKYQGHFGCCSRNLEMKNTPNNAIWQMARKYSLPERLLEGYAIQAELVGPKVQGNPLG